MVLKAINVQCPTVTGALVFSPIEYRWLPFGTRYEVQTFTIVILSDKRLLLYVISILVGKHYLARAFLHS